MFFSRYIQIKTGGASFYTLDKNNVQRNIFEGFHGMVEIWMRYEYNNTVSFA